MNNLKKIWDAYLKGEASEEEKKQLLKAIEKNNLEDEISKWMKENWKTPEPAIYDNIADAAIFKKIKQEIERKGEAKIVHPLIHKKWWRYAMAACMIGLLGMAVYLYSPKGEKSKQWAQLEVKAGEKATAFDLPDGSKVWLNVASDLEYNFTEHRKIKLSGEAYFEVAKNKAVPFQVNFGNNELLVTGTQFNIKAYANEDQTKVHVKEGSVAVYSPKDTNQLAQNNYLVVNELAGTHTKKSIAFAELQGWTDGRLIFQNAPLEEVFNSIERQYGVGILLKKESRKKEKPLTATYPTNTKLKDVMEGLEYLQEVEYEFITADSLVVRY